MDVSGRRKKTPINFFLSLGKGGVQTYCPCFLMSALETTEILPSLARLVAHISSHSTPPTDSPERSNLFFFFYLCRSLFLFFPSGIVFCHSCSLAPHSPTTTRVGGIFFFPLETHTNTDTQTQKSLKTGPQYNALLLLKCQAKHQCSAP